MLSTTALDSLHRHLVGFARRLVGASALALLLPAAASAIECGWLATSELDRLFPQNAPWRVTAGGEIGSCQFLSRQDQPPNVFGANQMIHETEAAAVESATGIRTETEKNFETTDRRSLGPHGFSYAPGPAAASGPRSMMFVGQRGRVVVLATVSFQEGISEATLPSLEELVAAALSVADDPGALAAGTDCPWFEASLLDSVLPGGGVTQQRFGDTSCMAQDAASAVLLVTAMDASPAMLGRRDGSCSWEDLPALGADAALSHSCSSGNPRATVRVVAGGKLLDYSLTPGHEPSTEQRQALVELVAAVAKPNRR